jgi:hypothetical protein
MPKGGKPAAGRRRSRAQPAERSRQAATTAAADPPAELALTTPFALRDEEIEALLLTGEKGGALEDYFGSEQYDELRRLAQQASSRSVRGGDRVLILPGIMGSKLGCRRPILDNVIWADPVDLALGRLAELALPPPGAKAEALGVILVAYLTLKYRLRIAGFDADFFPFDWRETLPDVGRVLAAAIRKERAAKPNGVLHLVAHSMGGLVARASLPHLDRAGVARPNRIVMLGTPNFGSYAPVQAFRGTSGTVNKIAALDQRHTKAQLAEIFGGFRGLLEMIPSPKLSASNLFDLDTWPASGVRPDRARLKAAGDTQAKLPVDHSEIVMICGVRRETVVDAKVDGGEFVYTLSQDGDGTVPLALARIPTARRTYYVEEEHGALPGNGRILSALPSLLNTGETKELADSYQDQRAAPRTVRERDLAIANEVRSRGVPSVREQRLLLSEFAAPPPVERSALGVLPAAPAAAMPDPSVEAFSPRVVVGRSRQQRLDITLARGDITQADAACYVVGLFQNVNPSGAAGALDAAMSGALSELMSRRMFGANIGEISILPKGRHPLRAQSVAFAGLGAFDRFDESSLNIVGENLIRTFVAARIDDFAVVPLGAASGGSLKALQHLMTGFLRGLKDADREQRFRGITICERDEARYLALRNELYRLSPTGMFDDVELVFQETVLPPATATATETRGAGATGKVYLIVRQDFDREDMEGFTASLLTDGATAAIESGRTALTEPGSEAGVRNRLEEHLRGLEAIQDMDAVALGGFGNRLGELVLPASVRQGLLRSRDKHVVVVHDAGASRVPWETVAVEGAFLSEGGGLSHRYEAANFSVAKWMNGDRQSAVLRVLLIVDPTSDLAGARREGERIEAAFRKLGASIQCRKLFQEQASRLELLRCFASGEYDVVHYAGHAYFDPVVRSQSGLLCAGREVLSGADLANVGNLPALMFFNACEAARVRKAEPPPKAAGGAKKIDGDAVSAKSSEQVLRNTSFAESLLRGGVANFLGTYWPVGDAGASQFADTFYGTLLEGATLNAALSAARAAVKAIPSPDWADYVFYGDPDFRLKTPRGGGAPPGE